MADPQNRKTRRAAAQAEPTSAGTIPLARPVETSNGQQKAKTLIEVLEEKEAELSGRPRRSEAPSAAMFPAGARVVEIGADGEVIEQEDGILRANLPDDTAENEEESDPEALEILNTIFLSLPLSSLHLTLSILAAHQYLEKYSISALVVSCATVTFPLLTLLIHLFHGNIKFLLPSPELLRVLERWRIQEAFWCAVANFAGCYLVSVTNDHGYYAVMRQAPGIGTVWVWAVIEMGVVGSLVGVMGPALYTWYYGYTIV